MNVLPRVEIPGRFRRLDATAPARCAGFSAPAISHDEKFKHQCELHHSGPRRCSFTEKGIGKRGVFEQSAVSFPLVVIYITSVLVNAPI
jgi:hypothetical protein